MFRQCTVYKSEWQTDVIPLFAGEEDCKPHHNFGPYIREHYLLHFCLSGKGVFFDKSGEHAVGAGEFFIIRPGEVTRYVADGTDPWHYVWFAFRGSITARFDPLSPVLKTPEGIAERLYALIDAREESPDPYCAFTYELAHALSLDHGDTDALSRVHRFVRYHYMEALSVESIASSFGFERSYLYRIFKKRYGIGLKEHITAVRMQHAKAFLSQGMLVSQAARIVGYADEFNFSRAYKKFYKTSPKADKCK